VTWLLFNSSSEKIVVTSMLCKMNVFKVVMKVFSAIKNWLYKYMGKKQCLPVTEVNVSKDVRCFYEQLEGLLPLVSTLVRQTCCGYNTYILIYNKFVVQTEILLIIFFKHVYTM
jgi:hypothetical protein